MSKTTIGFTGDISFSAFFKDGYKRDDLISPEILSYFEGNDANVVNQESPITDCRITKKKRLSHRSDVEVIPYYKKTIPNVVFSLANNHMHDYNRIGVIDSIENLENNDCSFIGIGRNRADSARYVIIGDEVRVGVISIEYKRFKNGNGRFASPFYEGDIDLLGERIRTMKKKEKVDWVVVVYHGGEEFLNFPLPHNRKMVHRIANLGADAVVAHHPHVVQGYEYYKGKPIFYSLGNFIFDTTYQRAQEGTTEGMLVRLHFTKDEITWDNLPVHIDRETATVGVGEPNPYFINLADVSYNANWTYQCVRKKESLERATVLRESEKAQMAEEREQEAERIEAIKAKYAVDEDEGANDADDLDAAKDAAPAVRKGKRYYKKLARKAIRAVLNKKKRTYRWGRLLYKTLYRGKELKA